MPVYSPTIHVMIDAVLKAAKGLVRDFGEIENLQVSTKGPQNFVSTADTRTEKRLIKELSTARPDYGFLVEEQGEIPGVDANNRWIIDPLDGTTNFLHGLPFFCITVALERMINGRPEIVAGVTYAPIQKEIFWAEKGAGAFIEGEFIRSTRLRVSSRRMVNEALLGVGSVAPAQVARKQQLDSLSANITGARRMGSAALELAYVAAGRLDGYLHNSIKPWDIAAGILLVREAGGYVSDFDAKQEMFAKGTIVAANEKLHKEIMKYCNTI